MPEWATFAGFAGVVLFLLLALAHASRAALHAGSSKERPPRGDGTGTRIGDEGRRRDEQYGVYGPRATRTAVRESTDPGGSVETGESTTASDATSAGGERPHRSLAAGADAESVLSTDSGRGRSSAPNLSTSLLLANVAVSQGAFGALLLAGAWYSEIPPAAFGASSESVTIGFLGIGVALGVVLYVVTEVGAAIGERVGLGRSEEMRALLTPETRLGWAALLLVVLPIIAGFEELLFRGALVGALSMGFGLSPWLLAALSSVAFGLGHGAQGPVGVVVTGVLGFVLAAAFVATGSLLVVVVAHYLVNALEFVVHEGLDLEWV